MKRPSRPKYPPRILVALPLSMAIGWPGYAEAQSSPATGPLASSYATRDGRSLTTILGCSSTDGSFTAQPCGVAGFPLHVQVDGANGGSAPGTASSQVSSVQGGGPGALPVTVSAATLPLPAGAAADGTDATSALAGGPAVAQGPGGSGIRGWLATNTAWTQAIAQQLLNGSLRVQLQPGGATQPVSGSISVSNLPVTQPVSGSVTVANIPTTQAISAAALPLPTGAATAANQAVVNADGGAQVHLMNPPSTQAVTGSVTVTNLPTTQAVSGSVTVSNLPSTQAVSVTALPLPTGAATAANQAAVNADGGAQVHLMNPLPAGANTIGTVLEANRSGAWADASYTAASTASTPAGLGAVASRTGLHIWNLGAATVCLNYTATAAAAGGACTPGSVPVAAGSAYLEDQPGNVSPEAISLVCAGTSCPLTIKVR